MKGILEYIDNYGDLSFEEKDFNKVDSLILSQFSYLKMDKVVPGVGTMKPSILLKDIAKSDELLGLFSDERYAEENIELFDRMSNSKRFGNIGLNHHIDLVNKKWEMQFSAITCYLAPGLTHVVFRGTDETVIGWKEDFNMAFTKAVPAQTKAVDYLRYVAERIAGDFSVGGHSKGGNLAVYAAMKCPEEIEKRIIRIDSHDGPGFIREVLEESDFEKIKSRVKKYVPHSSVIGMMLQSQEEYRVITAKSFGILQHDPFNWVVEEDDFVYRDDIAYRSAINDEAINKWAQNADNDELKTFIGKLFDIFTKSGIDDLNDCKGNYMSLFASAIETSRELSDEEKSHVKNVLGVLARSFKNQLVDQIKDHINDYASEYADERQNMFKGLP